MTKEKFLQVLREERGNSVYTVEAYGRDLGDFETFLKERTVSSLNDAGQTDVIAYMRHLKDKNRSNSTQCRRLSALRSYYRMGVRDGSVGEDPTTGISTPAPARRGENIPYFTIEEINMLMEMPDDSTKGIRDKAMLELVYATGIKAAELVDLNLSNLNMSMGFVTWSSAHGLARIIPMNNHSKEAMKAYLETARPILTGVRTKDEAEDAPVFVNYKGGRMTRQGFWLVMKEYGKRAGLETVMTPHVLRNSFAIHMIQNGADLKTLQELMGSRDLQPYIAVTKNRIKDVYDRAIPRK